MLPAPYRSPEDRGGGATPSWQGFVPTQKPQKPDRVVVRRKDEANPLKLAIESDGRTKDRSRWHFLLLLPLLLAVALLPVYNRPDPRLWSITAFFWGQFALLLVCMVVTAIVFLATKQRRR